VNTFIDLLFITLTLTATVSSGLLVLELWQLIKR
jgi:hypothetical protein